MEVAKKAAAADKIRQQQEVRTQIDLERYDGQSQPVIRCSLLDQSCFLAAAAGAGGGAAAP